MAFTKTAGVEYGTPAVVLSTTAASGSNQTAIRTDGQLIAFNADTPENVISGSASAGTTAFAARIDHIHSGLTDISAKVTHDAAQSTSTGSEMTVAFNTETFDSDSMADVANRLTFTTAGTYLVQAYVQIEANAAGRRHLALRLNGTGNRLAVVQTAPSISEGWGNQVAVLVAVSAADYIEVRFLQTSGGALNIQITNSSPWLSAVKILA